MCSFKGTGLDGRDWSSVLQGTGKWMHMVDSALQIDAHICMHIISISHRSGTLIWTRIHAAHCIVWVRLIGGFHKEENCHYAGLQHSGWLSPTIAHCQNWLNIYILPEHRLFLYKPLHLRTFLLLFAPCRAEVYCVAKQTYFKLQGRHLLPRCLICHA